MGIGKTKRYISIARIYTPSEKDSIVLKQLAQTYAATVGQLKSHTGMEYNRLLPLQASGFVEIYCCEVEDENHEVVILTKKGYKYVMASLRMQIVEDDNINSLEDALKKTEEYYLK